MKNKIIEITTYIMVIASFILFSSDMEIAWVLGTVMLGISVYNINRYIDIFVPSRKTEIEDIIICDYRKSA